MLKIKRTTGFSLLLKDRYVQAKQCGRSIEFKSAVSQTSAQWKLLTEQERKAYNDRADTQNALFLKQITDSVLSKKQLFADRPKAKRVSAYGLFVKSEFEKLSVEKSSTSQETRQRLSQIAKKWKLLPFEEKTRLHKDLTQLKQSLILPEKAEAERPIDLMAVVAWKSSVWHNYVRQNFKNIQQKLAKDNQTFGSVIGELSSNWHKLSKEEKDSYRTVSQNIDVNTEMQSMMQSLILKYGSQKVKKALKPVIKRPQNCHDYHEFIGIKLAEYRQQDRSPAFGQGEHLKQAVAEWKILQQNLKPFEKFD